MASWQRPSQHLPTSLHPSITFTVEIEEEDRLPFLGALIIHNNHNNTLETKVYCKPTHTNESTKVPRILACAYANEHVRIFN